MDTERIAGLCAGEFNRYYIDVLRHAHDSNYSVRGTQHELITAIVAAAAALQQPAGHQVQLRTFTDGRAEVSIIGDGPLAPGRYRGTVVRAREGEVA